MEKTILNSSLLKILSENYKNKLHLLKSEPSSHLKSFLELKYCTQTESDNFKNNYKIKIQKIFISKVYDKPNSYQNKNNIILNLEAKDKAKISNKNFTLIKNEHQVYDEIDLEISEEVDHSKFNFTKKDKRETLLAISNEKIIHQDEEIEKEIHINKNNLNVHVDLDLIAQNIFPLSNLHLLLLPRFSQILPQFLNCEKIWKRIFKFQEILNEKDLVIGYNSKGGASSVNHLHFHFTFLRELEINFDDLNFLQNIREIEIYKLNNFISDDGDSSTQVKISFCENENFKFYKIFLSDNNILDLDLKSTYCMKVLNILHSLKIPYNILILNNQIFIFPRKHDNLLPTKKFAFFEILGVYSLDNIEVFNNFTIEEYLRLLNELWFNRDTYFMINEMLEKVLQNK